MKIEIKDRAIDGEYTNITGTTSGSGTGAKFTVTKTDGVYSSELTSAGTGYAVGDTITLPGTGLGGTAANNLIVTVGTIGAAGAIATFGSLGTGLVGDGIIDILVGVDGSDSLDTYDMSGDSTDFTVVRDHSDIIVTSNLATNVEFTLANHERVVFDDKSIAFDIIDGAAGFAYSLAAAGLGTADITDEIMGTVLSLKDGGLTDKEVAQEFIKTDAFKQDAGGTSDETFVKNVWKNMFGTPPTLEQLTTIVGVMATDHYDQADVLVWVANNDDFQTTINLVGLETTGVNYIPI